MIEKNVKITMIAIAIAFCFMATPFLTSLDSYGDVGEVGRYIKSSDDLTIDDVNRYNFDEFAKTVMAFELFDDAFYDIKTESYTITNFEASQFIKQTETTYLGNMAVDITVIYRAEYEITDVENIFSEDFLKENGETLRNNLKDIFKNYKSGPAKIFVEEKYTLLATLQMEGTAINSGSASIGYLLDNRKDTSYSELSIDASVIEIEFGSTREKLEFSGSCIISEESSQIINYTKPVNEITDTDEFFGEITEKTTVITNTLRLSYAGTSYPLAKEQKDESFEEKYSLDELNSMGEGIVSELLPRYTDEKRANLVVETGYDKAKSFFSSVENSIHNNGGNNNLVPLVVGVVIVVAIAGAGVFFFVRKKNNS